jgi:NAD(P)-dependent dehydrogenase (short-subunit alcohol dehydrogenase family)
MNPDKRLSGRVAIITGAGSRAPGIGNGRASAVLLARHGARVTLIDVTTAAGEETARMIRDEAGTSQVIEADVTDSAACEDAVARTIEAWGRLDILVNNVGIIGPAGTATEVDPDSWDAAMRVNVTSMMLMAKHSVPQMRKSGGGSIVNIASVAGLVGGNPNLFYPTSKGAVVNMTRAMAVHHAPDGIRVNCIAPGMVYTPMVAGEGMSPELREARRNRSLLRTEGTGWDVGHGVLYLASDESRWVTGIVLPIDAGASAAIGRWSVQAP